MVHRVINVVHVPELRVLGFFNNLRNVQRTMIVDNILGFLYPYTGILSPLVITR